MNEIDILDLLRNATESNKIIKYINNNEFDINYQDDFGKTALILSIVYNYPNIFKELLNHPKINPNLQDDSTNTALI